MFTYDNDRYMEPAIVVHNKSDHVVIVRIIVSDIDITVNDKYGNRHGYDMADPNDFDFDKFTVFIDGIINCATKKQVTTGVRLNLQGLDKLIC
jgi:hypothetical protein